MAEPITIYKTIGTVKKPSIFDITDTEALLVRKSNDSGDIFAIDTTNGVVSIGGVAPVTGCRLVLPQENDAVTPTLAFGDGDTGFYEYQDDNIILAMGGGAKWLLYAGYIEASAGGGPRLANTDATGIAPVFTFQGDTDTGLGNNTADQVSLITGGVGTHYKNAAGSTYRWCTQESVADSGKVTTAPTNSNGGFGFAQIGDGQEYALFSFTSAGVVTLISNSANVSVTEDNDTTFNIYDNGTNIGFNNELGSTLNLFVMLWYN